MKYFVVYFFFSLGGNIFFFVVDVKKVFDFVGIEVDSDCFDKFIFEFEGKDVNEVWMI